MCTPLIAGVLSFGLGIAQSVGSYMQQSQAAANQNAMYEQNKANAQAAFSSQENTLQQRQAQEQDAEAQRSYDMAQEYDKAHATAVNNSTENGQAGLSIDALLSDLDTQEVQRQQNSQQNLEWTLEDLQSQKISAGYNYVSNVNSVPKGQSPSFGNLAIGILGAGLQGYNEYGSATAQANKAYG